MIVEIISWAIAFTLYIVVGAVVAGIAAALLEKREQDKPILALLIGAAWPASIACWILWVTIRFVAVNFLVAIEALVCFGYQLGEK